MIQTFPASFKLGGSKTEVEQIIGNAVPVKLAEYVALRLKEYLSSKNYPSYSEPDDKVIEAKKPLK